MHATYPTLSSWPPLPPRPLSCPLQALNLEVARKAFIRIRDVRFVELVNRTEAGRKAGTSEQLLLAEIMAFQGRYQEAARLFTQAGELGGGLVKRVYIPLGGAYGGERQGHRSWIGGRRKGWGRSFQEGRSLI